MRRLIVWRPEKFLAELTKLTDQEQAELFRACLKYAVSGDEVKQSTPQAQGMLYSVMAAVDRDYSKFMMNSTGKENKPCVQTNQRDAAL